MTISNTASSATYTGNGSQQIFDVKDGAEGIYFDAASELYVTLRDGDTITPQTITTHYTVSGAGTDTGAITFLTAPGSGIEVRIERRTPLTQTLSLTAGGSFNPANVEANFDKVFRALQDQSRGSNGGEASGTYDGDALTKTPDGGGWDGEDLPLETVGFIEIAEQSAPSTPSSGYGRLYVKTDGSLNFKDDAGTETDLTSGAIDAAASASAAATSASAASTSASAASTSASAASTSASNASTSASNASTSATNASNSASAASTSETNAATSASAAAAAAGFSFTYSTTTTMADPGSGAIRFNNATLASVTAIAIDDLSADTGNPDVSAWILTFDNSTATSKGLLRFRKKTAPQNFVDFVVTGLTDNSGWTELAVTHAASSGSLSNSDALLMAFYATGDAGPTGPGSGDVNGPASSVGSEIVLFDGTTGKQLKSATTTGLLKATSGVLSAAVSGTDYAAASHTHATSDVTGLDTALAGKALADGSNITGRLAADVGYPGGGAGPDLNTVFSSGVHRLELPTNGPGGIDYGVGIVARGSDVALQIFSDYASGKLAWRSGNSANGGGAWGAWRTILHDGNYSSYAAALAGANSFTSTNSFTVTVNHAIAAVGGTNGLEARGNSTGAAYMTFHRPGSYALALGLDTDNVMKIGGWSFGTPKVLIHEGNIATYAPSVSESGELSVPSQNTAVSWTHGLGSRPRAFGAKARCLTAEHGYAVGDEIELGNWISYGDAAAQGVTANATTVKYHRANISGWYAAPNGGSGSLVNLTTTSWRIVFWAMK